MSMEKKATRVAYGEYIAKLGDTNDKLVVLDADLAGATMTQYFKKAHPDRFFDCGIAEANMVDLAAGMSTTGLVPFCSTFAVFASRCLDQIRNLVQGVRVDEDRAEQRLLCGEREGKLAVKDGIVFVVWHNVYTFSMIFTYLSETISRILPVISLP